MTRWTCGLTAGRRGRCFLALAGGAARVGSARRIAGAGIHGPADRARPVMYLEGSDQHRGWFQSSLLASGLSSALMSSLHTLMPPTVATTGMSPYRTLLTHGF